jgi:hypothetical protein
MYGVYLRSVEENQRRRHREQQREMEHESLDGVTAQRFYSFTHAGKCLVFLYSNAARTNTVGILHFTL